VFYQKTIFKKGSPPPGWGGGGAEAIPLECPPNEKTNGKKIQRGFLNFAFCSGTGRPFPFPVSSTQRGGVSLPFRKSFFSRGVFSQPKDCKFKKTRFVTRFVLLFPGPKKKIINGSFSVNCNPQKKWGRFFPVRGGGGLQHLPNHKKPRGGGQGNGQKLVYVFQNGNKKDIKLIFA